MSRSGASYVLTGALTLNVKDYGAKGDGITDDTVAVQNALNAIIQTTGNPISTPTGGTVFFPKGRYKITSTLTLTRGVLLEGVSTAGAGEAYGDSVGSVLLASTASMTLFTINGATGTIQSAPRFRNLIFADTTGNTVTLVGITNANRWQFLNCSFKDALVGLNAVPGASGDCSWWSIVDCTFYNCNTGVLTGGSGDILSGNFVNCSTVGIDTLGTSAPLRIFGPKFDVLNTAIGVRIKGYRTQLVACAFELTNTSTGIIVDKDASPNSGTDNQLIGCEFTGHSGTETAINLTANATRTQILTPVYAGVGTKLADNGVNTQSTVAGDLLVGNKSTATLGNLGTTDFWIDTSGSAQTNSGVSIRGKGTSGIYLIPGGTTMVSATPTALSFYGVAPVARAAAITAANTQTASYVQADVQSIATAVNAIRAALTAIGITS